MDSDPGLIQPLEASTPLARGPFLPPHSPIISPTLLPAVTSLLCPRHEALCEDIELTLQFSIISRLNILHFIISLLNILGIKAWTWRVHRLGPLSGGSMPAGPWAGLVLLGQWEDWPLGWADAGSTPRRLLLAATPFSVGQGPGSPGSKVSRASWTGGHQVLPGLSPPPEG